MATFIQANENAKKEFQIPVTWSVFDKVTVQANSLKEAYDYVNEHLEDIPLGDNETYVEASYQISADSTDECVIYQTRNDVICTEFKCENDLSKYVDSMLFDSTSQGGGSIASGTFVYNNQTLTVYLDICGEVSVTYKNETFHKPSEFPEELRELIKKHPNDWSTYAPSGEGNDDYNGCDIYVGLNNWFEYIFNSDGEVLEADLSKMTAEQILDDMYAIARQYFNVSSAKEVM